MEQNHFVVCVRCSTFNHASFIEETMNGFTIQRTNFSYVCCIIDDASTDGEPEVIRNYLYENFDIGDNSITRNEENDNYVLTFVRHKKNRNCFFAVLWLKYNHYRSQQMRDMKLKYISEWYDNAKYHAVCEGDDFWIDPYKLQKQYDILERDNTISMCHHNFYELCEDGGRFLRKKEVPTRQDLLSIAKENSTQTLTMFFRNIKPLIPKELKGRRVYSQFWALRLAEFGDIYYIDEPMAVYRRTPNSIYGTKDAIIKFKMSINNLDNMIFWFRLRKRKDVIEVLSKRVRKTCWLYTLHFIRRLQIKEMFNAFRFYLKYLFV